MIKKEAKYWEVEVKFLVRQGSYKAKTKDQLKENVLNGIGKNEMGCIKAENIEVDIK